MTGRRLLPLIALATVAASCSTDGDDAGPASATILTTTTVASAQPATGSAVTEPSTPLPNSTDADRTDPTATATTTAPDTAAATTTATAPPTAGTTSSTSTVPARVGDPVVAVEPVASFDQPVDLAVRPADDALWIVEQGGRVVRFAAGEPVVALDIAGRVSTANEQGLLGLAFAPADALAYVNFTDRGGSTVVAEFAVTDDLRLDPTSERTIITIPQPFSNHNAGDLAFGPDGMLYIPLGDGGSANDPNRVGSDPTSLLGSLLRIDPSAGDGTPYAIPPGNPFADGPLGDVAGAPEVWAWGLRNPWKVAFDPLTGALWIADVGQNEFEEINMVGPEAGSPAGFAVDFGWSAFEGTSRFNDDVADTGTTTPPVLTYDHGDGCSISGGVPYRGTAIPELEPAFVYSDFCTSAIWALDLDGGRNLTLLEGLDQVAAVRAGPDGELYVLQRSGTVFRLVPG